MRILLMLVMCLSMSLSAVDFNDLLKERLSKSSVVEFDKETVSKAISEEASYAEHRVNQAKVRDGYLRCVKQGLISPVDHGGWLLRHKDLFERNSRKNLIIGLEGLFHNEKNDIEKDIIAYAYYHVIIIDNSAGVVYHDSFLNDSEIMKHIQKRIDDKKLSPYLTMLTSNKAIQDNIAFIEKTNY